MTHGSSAPETAALLAHEGFVRAIVRSLLRDEGEVDDVVQDTWVAALERPPRRRASLRSWLGRVAMNLARDRRLAEWRRQRRENRVASSERVESAASLVERLSRQQAVVEAVLALEEPYRETVLLRFYEELPPREIARRQGTAVDTVHTRLRRARERLRIALEPESRDLKAWLLAAWPDVDKKAPAAAGIGTTALVTGAIVMGIKTKVALTAAAVVVLGSVVTWQIIERDEPVEVSTAEATPAGPAPEGRATRMLEASSDEASDSTKTDAAEASAASDEPSITAPTAPIDPACREERLLELLAELEEEREADAVPRCEQLHEEIASCGDVAVPVVRRVMIEREAIASDCVQILALIGGEKAIAAGLSILDEPGLPDLTYWELRRPKALVELLGERHVPGIGSSMDDAPAPMARITAANLLSGIPSSASVKALVAGLEDEADADVIKAILQALIELGHQHGLAIPIDRVLELVPGETLQEMDALATLVAIVRPWPQALEWVLHHSPSQQYSYGAMMILLERGGREAEQAIVAAAEKRRADARSKGAGIQHGYDLLRLLAFTSDPTWSAPVLEERIFDLSDYEGLERNDYHVLTDTAKGNLLLALTLMPENEALYRTLEALVLPSDDADRTLSRRLRKSTWTAVRNVLVSQDHARRSRVIAFIERAFEYRPETRGEILDLMEELRGSPPPVGEDMRRLIERLSATADESWRSMLEELRDR